MATEAQLAALDYADNQAARKGLELSDNEHYRVYPLANLFAIGDTDGDEVILHWDALPHLAADLLCMMDDADWPRLFAYLQNKAPALAHMLRTGIREEQPTDDAA